MEPTRVSHTNDQRNLAEAAARTGVVLNAGSIRGPVRERLAQFAMLAIVLWFVLPSYSQTISTGALTGVTLDLSGAVIPGVAIQITGGDKADTRTTVTDDQGRFGFLLLAPGVYQLRAAKSNFETSRLSNLQISVTETLQVQIFLSVGVRFETLDVFSDPAMVHTNNSVLGGVVGETAIKALPLVTRNFTQIAGLSPGVAVGVYNAGELGSGGTALSQVGVSNDGIFVHGARSYDNNWQLDGISVTDVIASGAASGGIPIPNPDSIEEFKVQTGLYDAEFGRTAGGNVSVMTKAGSEAYHGEIFEFLRNDVLNANDFFLNKAGQQRPALKQNQFGFALGGPIKQKTLFFFASYQGTRQVNGLAAGQARIGCAATVSEPPITNDRSPEALGQLFGGQKGALGGVAINTDGSNINPVALALLNFKLPDGSFLIPTPQVVDSSKPLARSGFSAFAQPCDFREDQGVGNLDYVISQKSRLASRFFVAKADQLVTFPSNGSNPIGNIRGFDSPGDSQFIVASLSHTYTVTAASLNEARVGFVRTKVGSQARAPFTWSGVGVSESDANENNELPSLNIVGSIGMAPAFQRTYTQNTASASDVLSVIHGAHLIKSGGSLTRLEENFQVPGLTSALQFLSWPDFLLGLDAAGNGTGQFSNVFSSTDFFGLFDREVRGWEGSGFVQDDYRVSSTLVLNLGVRYERLGHLGDELGRNSSFDAAKATSNPPADGSLQGFVVGSNFPGPLPPGVIRAGNSFGNYGEGQNTIAPRVGFAWQLPKTSRLVLRGGYGVYYSRPTGQAATQSILGPPFSLTRISTGLGNAQATFQNPFAEPFPSSDSFPQFVPYSPSSNLTIKTLNPTLRPAKVEQISLNLQAEVQRGWLLEAGYVGAHGTRLQRTRSLNQALSASPENPIRGVMSNTLANIGLRVPIPGIRPDGLSELESDGESWYNGLEANLTKRLDHGLQFLASYTFSKTLDTDGSNINGTSAGNTLTLGDQNSPSQRWGRASFNRSHRFIISGIWTAPSFGRGLHGLLLGSWSFAAIATLQSGTALTIADTNSANVFGISEDRAQLSGKCSKGQFVTGGRMSSKLNNYFNESCFTNPTIIGADGMGTGFGNSATGLVDGPGQSNLDVAVSKSIALPRPVENSTIEVRAEFYNALNHPQFANPDTNFTSPTFGVISSTSVNPRVGQLAVKFLF